MSSPSDKDSQEYISFSDSPHQHSGRRGNLSNSFDRNQHRMNNQNQGYGRRGFGHNNSGDGNHHYNRRQFSHSTPYSRDRNSFRHNNYRNYSPHQNPNTNFQKKKEAGFDVTKYFHASMLDNPWAELEKKLEDKSENESDSSMDYDNESSNSDGSGKNQSVNSVCPDSFS